MANNLMEIVKKKLETPDQIHLSAADRALLEQTCKGLDEIKQQRLSEAAALSELKELIQSNPELFAEEIANNFVKLQTTIEQTALENQKLAEHALTTASEAQKSAEAALLAAANAQKATESALQTTAKAQEATENAILTATRPASSENTERRISSLTALCWISLLATLGTMTILILNILGIV